VIWLNDSGAVREQDHVRLKRPCDREVLAAALNSDLERTRAGVARRAAAGDAGVKNINVGSGFAQEPPGVIAVERVAHGQQVEFPREIEQSDFMFKAQTGCFERAAKFAIEPGDGREIVNSGYPDSPAILQIDPKVAQGVDSIDAKDDRHVSNLW